MLQTILREKKQIEWTYTDKSNMSPFIEDR